jgi:hypothetical protein
MVGAVIVTVVMGILIGGLTIALWKFGTKESPHVKGAK